MATIIYPAVGIGLIEWPWFPARLQVLYTARDEVWVRLGDLAQAFLPSSTTLYRPLVLNQYIQVLALAWGQQLQDPTWYVREDVVLSWVAVLDPATLSPAVRRVVLALRHSPLPLPTQHRNPAPAGSALRHAEHRIRQIMTANSE